MSIERWHKLAVNWKVVQIVIDMSDACKWKLPRCVDRTATTTATFPQWLFCSPIVSIEVTGSIKVIIFSHPDFNTVAMCIYWILPMPCTQRRCSKAYCQVLGELTKKKGIFAKLCVGKFWIKDSMFQLRCLTKL